MTQALFVDKKEHTFQTVTDATQETVRTILSSGQPVEIEIGCGKAKFILARAEANPAIQYMAFPTMAYLVMLLQALKFLFSDFPWFSFVLLIDCYLQYGNIAANWVCHSVIFRFTRCLFT